jgi:hypothetical protein
VADSIPSVVAEAMRRALAAGIPRAASVEDTREDSAGGIRRRIASAAEGTVVVAADIRVAGIRVEDITGSFELASEQVSKSASQRKTGTGEWIIPRSYRFSADLELGTAAL